MKPKLIPNLNKTRWVNLSKIKEFTITQGESRWKVTAWVDSKDCFTCFEADLKVRAEEWIEVFNQ